MTNRPSFARPRNRAPRLTQPLLSRREATLGLFALGGALVLACGAEEELPANDAPYDDEDAGTSGAFNDAGSASTEGWASGGTQAMMGDYESPFPLAQSTCALYVAATEGPCSESADQLRSDISEGYTGLPMRLALRIVDGACAPISGAKVKVWHTQISGSYSGNTPNPAMCLKDQADTARHYFRGAQTTDDDGRVDFDSCFPGWYRGRAVHVHFTVTAGARSFTSQIVFDQNLVDQIFTEHPEYKSYGLPDTPNASDNVVGNANLASYVAVTSRLDDGALMVAKQIVVNLG
jgi:protocatechuate 3,4-dioxygenase beta subunit